MEILNHKILGAGRPFVIVHGFLGSLDNWLTLGNRLAEHFKVVLVDQRNHGASFHSDDFDYSLMADDLRHLISALQLEAPVLLGHSMGGKTVMQYAALHAQTIHRLIVADIGVKAYPSHHERILAGLLSVPLATLKSRQAADEHLSAYVHEPETRAFLLKNLKRTPEGFCWKMNLRVLAQEIAHIGEALNDHLPLELKTLFVRGADSDYILDGDWPGIQKAFPHATLKTIARAGHWLHAEQPEQFYEQVMSFLR